jgi:hypothetical protein
MPSAMPAGILARRRELMLAGDADGFASLWRSSTRPKTWRWWSWR